MKTTFIQLLVAVSLLYFCPAAKAQTAPGNVQDSLNTFLDQWHRFAADGNHRAYIGMMDKTGLYIGTDASERWTAVEFSAWSKPHFDRKRTWNFNALSRHIYLDATGKTAWFDELLDTQMGVCRGSGVLLKKGNEWKIAQYVLSATIPNEVMKQVTTLKSSADSAIAFRSVFDRHGLTGTILILDPANEKSFGYMPALWDSGYLPASTFKIPNTLIGLETGVIDTGYIFKWNGEKRRLPQWEQDLKLADAFRVSCVPCFQELARKTGPGRMKNYLDKLGYPGMDVRPDNIDLFWLEGNSRITPRQQADFMRRLNEGKLPLKQDVIRQMKHIMVVEQTPGYTLYGKTGWAVRHGNNYGWFVGWIESGGKTWYIATLVEPKDQDQTDDFAAARKWVTMEALNYLRIIRR